MRTTEVVGWIGSLTGPLGAIVLALNIPVSKYGYLLFLTSSLAMCVYALHIGDRKVLVQNTLFSIINGIGVWRWVLPAGAALAG